MTNLKKSFLNKALFYKRNFSFIVVISALALVSTSCSNSENENLALGFEELIRLETFISDSEREIARTNDIEAKIWLHFDVLDAINDFAAVNYEQIDRETAIHIFEIESRWRTKLETQIAAFDRMVAYEELARLQSFIRDSENEITLTDDLEARIRISDNVLDAIDDFIAVNYDKIGLGTAEYLFSLEDIWLEKFLSHVEDYHNIIDNMEYVFINRAVSLVAGRYRTSNIVGITPFGFRSQNTGEAYILWITYDIDIRHNVPAVQETATSRTFWGAVRGSVAGAVKGAITGIVGGPAGMIAGAVVGGGKGALAGGTAAAAGGGLAGSVAGEAAVALVTGDIVGGIINVATGSLTSPSPQPSGQHHAFDDTIRVTVLGRSAWRPHGLPHDDIEVLYANILNNPNNWHIYADRFDTYIAQASTIDTTHFQFLSEENRALINYWEMKSDLPQMTILAGKRVVFYGSLPLLDYELPDYSLAVLNREELRILRNTIFARHGMIFQSNDLTEHFQQFGWYDPNSRSVYALLSTVDRENIRRIQEFENAVYPL